MTSLPKRRTGATRRMGEVQSRDGRMESGCPQHASAGISGQVPWSRTNCSKLTWRGSRPVMRQKSLTRKAVSTAINSAPRSPVWAVDLQLTTAFSAFHFPSNRLIHRSIWSSGHFCPKVVFAFALDGRAFGGLRNLADDLLDGVLDDGRSFPIPRFTPDECAMNTECDFQFGALLTAVPAICLGVPGASLAPVLALGIGCLALNLRLCSRRTSGFSARYLSSRARQASIFSRRRLRLRSLSRLRS